MRSTPRPNVPSRAGGFTMIELLIVAGVIALMAAVALPNIAGYLRTAKVRGGTGQVVGELQAARNRAVVRNTNAGVVFAILDANSYRYTLLDSDFEAPQQAGRGLSPLRDLPQGVTFVLGANTPLFGVGFDRLGRRCALTDTTCATVTQTAATMCLDGDARCADRPAGSYLDFDPLDNTTVRVRVRDDTTRIVRTIRIQVGGRVMEQR